MSSSPTTDLRFGGYIASVPSVAVLRNNINTAQYQLGDTIIVLGNSDISDGRGGIYAWNPASTVADDGFDVIAPQSGQTGRWLLAIGPTPELAALVLAVGNEQAARTIGDSTISASITTEQTVRADADEALAERTTTLESNFATQQTTLSGVVTGLTSANARITEDSTTQSTAIGSLASQIATLQAGYSAQQQAVDGLTTNLATTNGQIEDESVIRSNADSALATRTTTLEANYAAQQTDINGVVTNLATANANITEDAQTQTTALQALATRTTNLEADYAAANADISVANASISNEATTRSDADGALADQISTLQASTTTATNNLAASISNETTARTTADTSLAQSITTLEADTGSLDSRVTITESAISSLSVPSQAYWTVESVSAGNRAELSVYANANGGAGVDIVGDVTISGDLVVDGTVTTGKLASGAVTQYDQANNASTVYGSGAGTTYTLVSFTLDMAYAGDILMWATCRQSYTNTTGSHPWNLSISVDGTSYGYVAGGGVATDSASVSARASVDVGNHTISLLWYGDSVITIATSAASLIAMGAYK